MTNSFIGTILTSEKLLTKLNEFLNKILITEMRNEANRKLHSLIKKWQMSLADNECDVFEDICKIIEEDPKFKLPWTFGEVKSAVDIIRQLFNLST